MYAVKHVLRTIGTIKFIVSSGRESPQKKFKSRYLRADSGGGSGALFQFICVQEAFYLNGQDISL